MNRNQKRIIVDLITGFLGSGKTTFIHKYVQYLKDQGQTVRIIENEFGEVGIDTHLLKEEDCEILDLAGLCMCCVGKQEFIQMLCTSAKLGCDRILVEPSGIYDVDEFFEVLSLPQVQETCDIGSIITIADPQGMDLLTEEAKYLMFTQFLASGVVLMSKTQLLSEQEIEDACGKLDAIMAERGCSGGIAAELCTKSWDQLTETDFEDIMDSGYYRIVHDREQFQHAEVFQSVNVDGDFGNREDLQRRIEAIFASEDCGRIFRIKGFMVDASDSGYEINCTRDVISIKDTAMKARSLAVIGQKIRRKGLKQLDLRLTY